MVFQMSRKLLLDSIYVDASMDDSDIRLVAFAHKSLSQRVALSTTQAEELAAFQASQGGEIQPLFGLDCMLAPARTLSNGGAPAWVFFFRGWAAAVSHTVERNNVSLVK